MMQSKWTILWIFVTNMNFTINQFHVRAQTYIKQISLTLWMFIRTKSFFRRFRLTKAIMQFLQRFRCTQYFLKKSREVGEDYKLIETFYGVEILCDGMSPSYYEIQQFNLPNILMA